MSGKSKRPKVLVIGSINMDLVARCDFLPSPGETRTAQHFAQIPGGKGANQAVAASRSGGEVTLLGRVGNDSFADPLLNNLMQENVCCDFVGRSNDEPSGLAMIAVSQVGENQIVVVPGANGAVSVGDIDHIAAQVSGYDAVLVQLEIPLPTVVHVLRVARQHGVRTILDPAPAPVGPVPEELFDVDLICPNETEAASLTGMSVETYDDVIAAAYHLRDRGCRSVAITLGERGTMLLETDPPQRIEAYPIDVVDTTAAGDAFAGMTAVRWCETDSLPEAIRWGNAAGALAASRHGAQTGMAARDEIIHLMKNG